MHESIEGLYIFGGEAKMKWRKLTSLLVIGLSATLIAGCGGGGDKKAEAPRDAFQTVAGEKTADLVPQAQKEGKVVVYSITSRVANAAAGFEKKYGIKVEASDLKDFELIDKISTEGRAQAAGADCVICQDSGRVWGELLQTGYLQNYVPADMASAIPAENQKPLVFAYMNKVFVYNNETFAAAPPVTNIWQLTEPRWKGKFFFKSPMQEGINADFLTMLTQPENAAKLSQAYEDLYHKKLELTTKNAGYEWIKMAFQNGVMMGTSDTSMMESLGIRGQGTQAIGLLNYSKIRYAKTKNLAVGTLDTMQPLSGFYYPEYLLLVANAKHPAAAKLFIEYLMTEEGFAPWQSDMGTYSGNPAIAPAAGDKPLSEWSKILVKDDPQYIFENRAEVEEFISKYI